LEPLFDAVLREAAFVPPVLDEADPDFDAVVLALVALPPAFVLVDLDPLDLLADDFDAVDLAAEPFAPVDLDPLDLLVVDFDAVDRREREDVFLSPMGSASPTALIAPPATSPTAPAILPAVLPTVSTTLGAIGP
jgi:hypothetical protein